MDSSKLECGEKKNSIIGKKYGEYIVVGLNRKEENVSKTGKIYINYYWNCKNQKGKEIILRERDLEFLNKKEKEIIGKKYGDYTVIALDRRENKFYKTTGRKYIRYYWKCRNTKGKERIVETSQLEKLKDNPKEIIPMIGRRYGDYTIIDLDRKEKNINEKTRKNKTIYFWKCINEKGEEKIVKSSDLKYLKKPPKEKVSIIGRKYGNYTVIGFDRRERKISRTGRKYRLYYWKCKDEEGNVRVVEYSGLKALNEEKKRVPIIGREYGDYTVIGLDRKEKRVSQKTGKTYTKYFWKCRSKEGKEKVVTDLKSLERNEKSKIIGRKYGDYTVIGLDRKENRVSNTGKEYTRYYYRCKNKEGKERVVSDVRALEIHKKMKPVEESKSKKLISREIDMEEEFE